MSIDHGARTAVRPAEVRVQHGDRAALDVALRWATELGWRPGRHDAHAFAVPDPSGLLSARRDEQVVTTLAAVRYGTGFGAVGLFITTPHERGQGIGSAVLDAGLAHLHDVDTIGLDAVREQEARYASLGFAGAHLSTRWSTGGSPVSLPVPGPRRPSSRLELHDARALGAAALDAYEQSAHAFPAPRAGFLEAWLALPESVSRVVVDADGQIRGWGTVRRCTSGAKVAPLVADDEAAAALLLDELLAVGRLWGETTIDVPDPNDMARALVEGSGLAPQWSCRRMYRGPDPGLDLARLVGLTSFELC